MRPNRAGVNPIGQQNPLVPIRNLERTLCQLTVGIVEVRHGLLEIQVRMTPRWTHRAKRQLPVAILESIMHMWFRYCTE
jgi:hypothetical protein